MKKSIIRSCTVNFPVDNLQSSIAFYKKVGFFIEETESTNYSVSTKLKFSEGSDFVICLTQALSDDRLSNNDISFDLSPMDNDDFGYDEVIDGYIEKGIIFENVPPNEVNHVRALSMIFKDPDGFMWSITNPE
jgi:predicted lactoylglutathione lyase